MSLHRITAVALVPVLAETKEANWRFARCKTKPKEKETLCYDEA